MQTAPPSREEAGEDLTLYRKDSQAAGAGAWPEWLGPRAGEFRVELTGKKGKARITALVHKETGHRRNRAAIEAAIAARVSKAKGGPADLRDLVGGPDRPLHIDKDVGPAPRHALPQPA